MEWNLSECINSLRTWREPLFAWETLRDFGNSTFFTSIAGAFAGAWAGGRIAQVLATRARNKEELEREIRKTNAAAIMASSLCDDLSGMLRQYVKPMKEQYDADLAAITALLAAPVKPNGPPPAFEANLMQLSGPTLHIENLERLIFGDISNNRAIRLFTALSQTVINVHSTVRQRNQLVEEFRAHQDPHATLRHRYFGFPNAHGQIDVRYKTTLEGLHSALWDGTYFSMQLALMLASHAGDLERRYKKTFGRPAPKAIELDFSRLTERGLMPDSKNYPDWDALLKPPPKSTIRGRIKERLRTVFAR